MDDVTRALVVKWNRGVADELADDEPAAPAGRTALALLVAVMVLVALASLSLG